MDVGAALARVDGADAKDLPATFEHHKMRDRGNDRFFGPGDHPATHQGTKELD